MDFNEFSKLSRRDALKQMGALSLAPLLIPEEAQASKQQSNAKIVIVGGGAAGLTVAARLDRALDNPDITIIEPSERHVYQAGHTLVGGGITTAEKLIRPTKDYITESTTWIKSKATEIDPDKQTVSTESGENIPYDYLVICPGLQYDWGKIEGLRADMIGQNGINSVYTLDGAQKAWANIQKFAQSGGEGIFCHPSTPIKCGGAPKKILYLTDAWMRKQKTREKANLTFSPAGGKLFSIPIFDAAIAEQFKQRDIHSQLKHNLMKIDADKKIATFKTQIIKKGAWDEDLEEYEEIKEDKFVTREYDFIHIPPPMSAPDFLKGSPVAWNKGSAGDLGLIKVDKYTLQHLDYKNIFSLGDVAGIPIGKTGGSVRKQAPVLVQNLLDVMNGKEPSAKHHGYTVCPIITNYGTVMLAEFSYDKKVTPTIPYIDPTEERWMWWVMKVYILEPMYYYGMLRGLA